MTTAIKMSGWLIKVVLALGLILSGIALTSRPQQVWANQYEGITDIEVEKLTLAPAKLTFTANIGENISDATYWVSYDVSDSKEKVVGPYQLKTGKYSLKLNGLVSSKGSVAHLFYRIAAGEDGEDTDVFRIRDMKIGLKSLFDPRGGTAFKNKIVPHDYDYIVNYGKAPSTKKTGYSFLGWYDAKSGGTKIGRSSEHFARAHIVFYAHWQANKYKVTLNPNTGKVATKSKTVTFGKQYNTLAKPSKAGYSFKGWFTKKVGGTKITATTKVATAKNHTLYAHWKKKV
jgi:uncharacterized repeat protein (TIGR02543 family)